MSHLVEHHAAVVIVEHLVAKFRTHTLFDDHITGNLSGFTKIRSSTSCNAISTVHDLLRNTPTHCTSKDILKLVDVGVACIFWWQEPCYAAGTTAWNDCYLMHRVAVWQDMPNNRVASLVVGRHLLFSFIHDLTLALWTNRYLFKGFS
ncbi:hypothetical protein D3C87_1525420 [compost metagenome]